MNWNRVYARGRVETSPVFQIAIERHDFDVMSTLNQSSTEIQDTAFYSSDFRVELPCDLQYSHQGLGAGPTNEKRTA